MAPIHPLEDARIAEDIARLRRSGRLDGVQADGAEGGCLRRGGGDGEDGEVGGGGDGGGGF